MSCVQLGSKGVWLARRGNMNHSGFDVLLPVLDIWPDTVVVVVAMGGY